MPKPKPKQLRMPMQVSVVSSNTRPTVGTVVGETLARESLKRHRNAVASVTTQKPTEDRENAR